MTRMKEDLLAFLDTPESADLTDVEVSNKFGCKVAVVKKERSRLKRQAKYQAEQEEAFEQATAELPDEDEPDDSSPSDDSPPVEFSEDPAAFPMADDLGSGTSLPVPGTYRMSISKIDLEAGTRVREPHEETVLDYARQMEIDGSTASFGALGVMYCTDLGRVTLFEGFQRVEAASRALGDDAVFLVSLQVGTLTRAIEEAMRANRKHGRKLTRPERIAIIHRVLEDERWGPKTSVNKISKITGDTDRQFITEVQKAWFKQQGQSVPSTRTVTRNGQEYEMDTSGMKKDRPRVHADAAEGSDVEAGTQTTPGEDQQRIDEEYLLAIPARANIHPDLLEKFDQSALARRDAQRLVNSANNFVIRFRGSIGDDNPLVVLMERVARLPQPVDVESKRVWTNCRNCEVPDPDDPDRKVSSGVDPETKNLPCRKCKGFGFRIPGL